MENKINLKKEKTPSCIMQEVFLKDYVTFKIGGKADFFSEVKTIEDFKDIADFLKKTSLDFFMLGGGSNTVFNDQGFRGLVIKNSLKGIKMVRETKDKVFLKVFSGEMWNSLVDFSVKNNLWGLENLTAIPGTVGGAVVQNIGAYGKEVGENIFEVEVINIKTGLIKKIKNKDLRFGYRSSLFKKKAYKNFFITSAIFVLHKTKVLNISYKDLQDFFKNKKNENINQRDVSSALKEIRGKKFPDLTRMGTAGSFFKNSILNKKDFLVLQKKFPEVSFFKLSANQFKISSAWLIDKAAGLKGFREGEVGLFENQSLVLVNFGNATAKELITFKEKIKKIVFKKTGIQIDEEVVLVENKSKKI